MGQKKEVKLEDIAAQAGVSIVSVSNALKGKKGVSEKMRNRIQAIADEMGYEAQPAGRQQEKEVYLIGVIVAERYVKEFPSFYMDVYKRVAQEAARRRHLTVLEVVNESKERLEQEFSVFGDSQVAGIILIGEMDEKYIKQLRKSSSCPIVCIDYYDIYEDMDYIVTDGYGGMEQMTELLLERGHRNLYFVGTPNATKNITDRYLGYCKALEKRGIKKSQEQIVPDRNRDPYDYRMNVELPEVMPDAFVCNCDKAAHILLAKLEEAGKQVPADVSVVSFDHFHSNTQSGLKITTYENDEKVIAQISISTLLKRIEKNCPPAMIRIIAGEVVEGNTVRDRGERNE